MYTRWKIVEQQLSQVAEAAWADQDRIKQLRTDILILNKFLRVIELMTYSIGEANEESMEPMTSVTISLDGIWPEDFTLLSLLIERMGMGGSETCPIDVCIHDFDSVMLELEGIFLQSKQIVEGWCRNSIHSLMMQCKPSKSQQASILLDLKMILILSKKQIHILRAKIEFLHFLYFQVEKEINEFLNFIGHLVYGAACLTFLYWAKKDDDETASVRFAMFQKFIPYAYDLTPLYVGLLKLDDLQPISKYNSPLYVGMLDSDNLQPISNSFLLGEAVESFVDFFFEHLAIVLKDDFLFLRDRLMFLFTFLINPPCENNIAEEEGDLIRSQIYAILHQDVYLLLSFDEMNKDFSDKKALFSAFMIRIDIVNAEIRQLYCGSSYSLMEYDYFVSLHRELSSIEKHSERAVVEQIQLYKMDLKFLRVFLLWLAIWDDTDEEIKVKLRSIITSFRGIWGEKEGERLLAHRLHAIRTGSITDLHPLAFELQGKIQQSKLETGAWCVNLFQSSFQFKGSTCNKILEFFDSILENLNDLVGNTVPFKKQIETLEEKVIFLKNFLKLAGSCVYYEELGEFKTFVQAFANDAACLTFLYWAKDINAETNSLLSHMLQKIKPATLDVARLYFGTLMAIYMQRSDCHMFGQTAFSFVQLFLEDLGTHLKDDDFQILQDNIVFLLTFLNDPLNQNAEESICSQIDVLFWEGLYRLIPFDDIKVGSSNKNMLLSEFMTEIEAINAKIRCIYGKFPDSALYNFPKVISPQFLDFLLQNLRNLKDRMNIDRKYAPFARYKIIKIEKELASLCPLYIHIFDIQSQPNEIWFEVVNVLHLTEHVIMSCISSWFVFDHPIWYHMAYLLDVFDEIKVVKAKLEKIKLGNIINNAICPPSSVDFISELSEHGRPSDINEIVVGFEDEKEKIIGMLTCGPMSLDIVSIVGMGGLGKTTLAQKVFGSSSVKSHFDVFAFCSVSLDYNTRRMLHGIIRDVKGVDDISRDMTKDDLAHELHKCLSRQKYLIILDDIWNLSAWNELKSSFPDHENGSRVMFTTRSLEVAKKCKINCSPHQLRFLNEVESWELFQKKVFGNDISPAYDLYEIGKQIAKDCKGLALAVVVIGGLLAKTEKSVRWWSDVARRLVDYLSEAGCMKILELSYKHLAENLKPCLIYFGAFPEDSLISVKQVIMLWIAEGFVQETNRKSLEDIAKEYFHDLVDRSFIIVTAGSSNGEIKTFRVHDLIHDLCRTKCRDGNFFQLNHEIASPSSLGPSINNPYRVTLKVSDAAGSSLSNARTVHFFHEDCYHRDGEFPFRKLGLVRVLDLGARVWNGNDINQLTSLIHLRYIDAILDKLNRNSIPSSISNLWNITSLTLRVYNEVHLPETFWRLKSLRHVNVHCFILKFRDDDNLSSVHQILDKVVSFSKPILSIGKDVKRLLQRLPVVQKMSCYLEKSPVYDEGSIETLDFYRELESLKLSQTWYQDRREYMIKFPSTLKKLTLERFLLPRTALSAIAELHCLEVLKLRSSSFVEPTLEMEDLEFRNLKFFQLVGNDLVEWNASAETFPCLEQLVIDCCRELKELPPCFEEMSTLKRIVVRDSPGIESWAFRIQEEVMELGIQLQLSIS